VTEVNWVDLFYNIGFRLSVDKKLWNFVLYDFQKLFLWRWDFIILRHNLWFLYSTIKMGGHFYEGACRRPWKNSDASRNSPQSDSMIISSIFVKLSRYIINMSVPYF